VAPLKRIFSVLFFVLLTGSLSAKDFQEYVTPVPESLYPKEKGVCYDESTLPVSAIHTMHYVQCGNPAGYPVVVFHGGPGGGLSKSMRLMFDPDFFRVILYDQRGAGSSTPYASIEENTTPLLIEDVEKLRIHLDIEKWGVMGHSWGATMALLYAEEQQDRTSFIAVAGIWLSREKDVDWYLRGGAGQFYPEAWKQFFDFIPADERGDLVAAYHKRLNGVDEAMANEAAIRWVSWEINLLQIKALTADALDPAQILPVARLENHYFANRSFISRTKQILRPSRLAHITGIPTVIINGRYDMVCNAYATVELHKALPSSHLVFTNTGHDLWDGQKYEFARTMQGALDWIRDQIAPPISTSRPAEIVQ